LLLKTLECYLPRLLRINVFMQ